MEKQWPGAVGPLTFALAQFFTMAASGNRFDPVLWGLFNLRD
jgi:hypothetical protein